MNTNNSRNWRKWVWPFSVSLVLILAASMILATSMTLHHNQHRPLGVQYGPWLTFDAGKAANPLKIELIHEGSGPRVESGDLIQLSLRGSASPKEAEEDEAWLWIGFEINEDSMNHRMLASFIGQKEGTELRFLESREKDSVSVGSVNLNPFGNPMYYAWYKGVEIRERLIYATGSAGYTQVRIQRVFKGSMKYRQNTLIDSNWLFDFPFDYVDTPRELKAEEMRFEGESADGRRASFQYGSTELSGKTFMIAADDYRRGERWIAAEWDRLPLGVQVE